MADAGKDSESQGRVFDPERHCGAKTAGGKCKQWKGAGTDHKGHGRCSRHGGATPNGRKHGQRAAALSFATGQLGAAVPTNPLDGLQLSIDLTAGVVDFYRHLIADAAMMLGGPQDAEARERIQALQDPYTAAIRQVGDMSKSAITAGVAERRQRMAEADAERLIGAIGEAVQDAYGDLATPERQRVFAETLRRRLVVFEPDRPALGPSV